MSTPIDLVRTTASDLKARLAHKEVSAVELCQASIDRIEARDGPINAVIVRDFEHALHDARAADAERAKGASDKPLLGVPMTVKESYDLAGYPTTWGIEANRFHRASKDALAVARLKAAGAVVLGKTNVPPVLSDWQSANPIYGRTNNPYDLTRSPGGSSGGSAAALAMGFSALELGSDIGGSIRIPAAFCGVFGHKPSWNIVPMTGHSPAGGVGAPTWLSVMGPLARSAADLDLALGVVAGPDEDAYANRLVLPPPRHQDLKAFRVFVIDAHPAAAVDSEIRDMISNVADDLARRGAKVMRASDRLPDMLISWRTYQSLLHTITTRRAPTGRPPITAHDLLDRLDDQHRIRRQWAEFFRDVDVVIAPTFGSPAFPHTDEPDWRKRALTIDGQPANYGAQLAWAGIATVANLPSTATPMGLGRQGLPLSLQVIGPHLEDRTSIAFAGLIARETAPPAAAL